MAAIKKGKNRIRHGYRLRRFQELATPGGLSMCISLSMPRHLGRAGASLVQNHFDRILACPYWHVELQGGPWVSGGGNSYATGLRIVC